MATLATEATRALRAAGFVGECAAHAIGGESTLMVVRPRYGEVEQILSAAGLVLEPEDFGGPDTYLAAAIIRRARRSRTDSAALA
jgi:hypothetical protein